MQPLKAAAATNGTINFQARLQTSTGAIVPDGNYNVQFKLYDVSSGGTSLWTETYQNSNSQGVTVRNGYLTANLGSITAFPGTINWDQDLWITLNIGGTSTGASVTWDGEMNPRLKLTSVPYAFRAGQLATFNSGTGYTSTLQILQPTGGNQLFQIPDQGAAGTYNICVQGASTGCTAASGSTYYIQNQSATPQVANFNIQSASSGTATAVIQGASGQSADLLTFKNGGVTVADVYANGGINTQNGYYVNGTQVIDSSGNYVANGAVVASSVSGTDQSGSNTPGNNLTLSAGNGTGSGGSGDIIFYTAPPNNGYPAVGTKTQLTNGNATTMTLSHTVTSGTVNRLLVVEVNIASAGVSVTGVTYGGTALTQAGAIDQSNTQNRTEMWYLVNPPVGTANVVVNLSGPRSVTVTAINVSGVSQSSPVGTAGTAQGSNTANPSVSVTSTATDTIIDALTDTSAYTSLGSGQTSIFANVSNNGYDSASYKSGSNGTVSSTYTAPSSNWSMVALPIHSASGATAPNTMVDRLHITQQGLVGINNANPQYQLDVNGDINTSTQLRIGGNVICTSTGCTPAGGSGSYIQNGTSLQSGANFNISGTGTATALQAGSFDAASAGTLNIGTTNATTLNIGTNNANHTIALGTGTGIQGITVGSTSSTSTLTLQGGSGTGAVAITAASGGTLSIGASGVANTIQIGNASAAVAQTFNLGYNSNASGVSTVNIGSASSTSATSIYGGTGGISLRQTFSSLTQTVARVVQGGTGDATLELNSSNISKSIFLGLENSSGGNFALGSSASNTGTASMSYATPAFVQSATTTDSSDGYAISAAFPSNTTAGNTIVVSFQFAGVEGNNIGCSDTQGDTFHMAAAEYRPDANEWVGVCYASNIVGGTTTTTVSLNPLTDVPNRAIAISEYSGLAKANAVDVTARNYGDATTATDNATSTAATTTLPNDLVYGVNGNDPAVTKTVTAGTGYTLRVNNNTAYMQTEDKVLASPGSAAATFTFSAAAGYLSNMVAFKAATITSYGTTTNTDNLANPMFKMTQSGAATFKNVTDSATAFQVQTSTGSTLLDADTTNARIGIGTNAPQYTLDVRGTAPSFQMASGSAPTSTSIFSDNFNRANGTLGSNWTTPYGTFAVSSNQATMTSTPGTTYDQEAYVNSVTPPTPDYSVSATVNVNNSGASDEYIGVVGRRTSNGASDSNGYYAFMHYNSGGSSIELWERTSGNWALLSTKNFSMTTSATYSITLTMVRDTIQVSVGGTTFISIVNEDITLPGTGGISQGSGGAANALWDNFSMNTKPAANGVVQNLIGDKVYLQGNSSQDASFLTYDLTNNRMGIGILNGGPQATLDVRGNVTIQASGSATKTLVVRGASGAAYFSVDTLNGAVQIDPENNNYGGLWSGLTFGSSECEGIASDRSVSNLNFYTGCNRAMSLGNDGSALFQNSSNSTTAFQVQDAGSNALLLVDTSNGNVRVDASGQSAGTFNHLLVFGGTASGEGIGSDRTGSSTNPYGLDFYVQQAKVFQLSNSGQALFKNISDSSSAFQVQNAAGAGLFSVDTSGNILNVGNGAVIDFGTTTRQMLNLWGSNYGIGVQGNTEYFRSDSDFQFYKGGVHSDTQGDPGAGGTSLMTLQGNGNVSIGMGNTVYKLDVNGPIHVCGDQTNCSHGRVYFGDNAYQYGSTNSDANNPWIGEGPSDDDLLEMSGSAGIWFQTGYTTDTYQYQSIYTESGNFCIDNTTCTHHLGVNGSAAASGGFATGTPDIAEYITTSPGVSAYDVVAADPNNTEAVVKATKSTKQTMVGVISDGTSGFMMENAHYGKAFDASNQAADPNAKPMTLAGRIPVHVTNEGGAIKPGDYLTASSTPGYAMKATSAGPTVGKALGFFDGTSGNTVLALINLGYYDPNDGNHLQAQSGSFDTLQAGSASFGSLNVSGPTTLASLSVTGDETVGGNLTVAGKVTVADIAVNGHIVTGGAAPAATVGVAAGQAAVVNGSPEASTQPTVAISGTDSTGLVTLVTGADNLSGGALAHLQFAQAFTGDYEVVVSASNDVAGDLRTYTTKTSGGFDIDVRGPATAKTTYQFTYMVLGASPP